MYILGPDANGTRYVFPDGRQIVIERGGEFLPNNSYGFELEFCSHDSSVFTFTHVDVLAIDFQIANMTDRARQQLTGWKLESDSGGVLELVTPPLFFGQVADAHRFRENIVALMTASVTPHEPVMDDRFGAIYAVLLGPWVADIQPQLANLCGTALAVGPVTGATVTIAPWDAVGAQLNQENIDDGVNIPAARMRHYTNRDSWPDYVQRIVLSRSEKDWHNGYASQLNMPMTLPGYFLYCHQKYQRSFDRMQGIKNCLDHGLPFPADLTDAALRKNIDTWFWRSVIWNVFEGYARLLWPELGNMVWTEANVARWTSANVTVLALLYVMVNKMLTGAMGSLSEPDQLKIQRFAWLENSTAAMNPDSPEHHEEMLLNLGEINFRWLEYHSAMKDLTGLWFKGALFDIIQKETIPAPVLNDIGVLLADPQIDVWSGVFRRHMTVISDDDWHKRMERARPDYFDELEELDTATLVNRIDGVRTFLGQVLLRPQLWGDYMMPPDRADRPFLHYADAPPWEGRYDTMIPPIRFDTATWTYLIEHRFN